MVYNHDNEPIKAYVYYDIDERRHIWEYDSLNVTEWLASKSGNSYHVLVETKPHGFIGIPLVECQIMTINKEMQSWLLV